MSGTVVAIEAVVDTPTTPPTAEALSAVNVKLEKVEDQQTNDDRSLKDPKDKEAKEKPDAPPPVGLRSLFRYADRVDAGLLVTGFVAVCISGANQPLQLVVFGRLLDSFNDLDKDEAIEKINFFAGCYALLGVQQIITNSLQSSCFSAAAARQTRRIRHLYFSNLARQPMAFADANDCGALASGVLESTNILAAGIGDELAKVLQSLLAFAIGMGVALGLAWRLALLTAAGIPLLGGIVAVAQKAYTRSTRESSGALGAASSIALEAIGAVRTLNAYGREPAVLESFGDAIGNAAKQGIQMGRARAMLEGAMAPIMFVLFGSGLWYGSSLVADDMEAHDECRFINATGHPQWPDESMCHTGGNVMTAFLSVLFGFMGLLQILPGLSALAAAKAAAAKIFGALDTPLDAIDALSAEGATPEGRAAGRIELRDVHFAYPSRRELPVYRGLSLVIEAGQTVALAGPSGCGKSTVVALLERFYDVDGGSLLLDGRDVKSLNVRWLRSQIGLVSQEPVLFAGSIGWNIGLGRADASQEDVEAAAALANAAGFVGSFPGGYTTEVGEKGVQLSGGQKQRIAIARALVRDPAILVLDEATSALDTASERVVQAALDELLAARRRTTLLIAHRLSTIRDADSIAVLSEGALVEQGTHDALMEREGGVYRALVQHQAAAEDGDEGDGAPAPAPARAAELESTKADDAKADAAGPTTQATPAAMEAAQAPQPTVDEAKAEGSDAPTEGDAKQAKQVKKGKKGKKEPKEPVPMRWLWGLSSPEKLYYLTGLLGAALTGFAMPAIGLLMAEFIVVFFNPDPADMRREAVKWAVIFMSMGVANAFGAVLRQASFAVITERLALRVRAAAFRSIVSQHVGWFDASAEHTPGALVNQLSNDCFLLQALTGERASIALSQSVVLIGGLYIAFDSSWALTLVIFAIIPVIVMPVAISAKVVGKYSDAAAKATVDAGRTASETLLHLRTVAAFGLEQGRIAQFGDELAPVVAHDVRKGIAVGVGGGVAAGAILIAAGFKYYIGGVFFDKGLVEFGDIMRVLLVLIFMAFGFANVSRAATDRAEAQGAARRVHALCTTVSEINALSAEGATPEGRAAGRIELRDVHFAYPSRRELPVYRGLSLVIEAGQTVALAGPSGCGKSTVVALLERFYDVDGGSLLLDGRDVKSLNVRWLRSQIGLVSQEPVLFAGSIGWNIGLGRADASQEDVEAAAALANAAGFVGSFPGGYTTEVGEKGVQLSGGQKQRIAIARALVRDPAILVLDEATSALDTASERVVQAALDELLAARRRTTLLIAHRLSTIRDADSIAVLSEGALVEQGTHDALMEREGGVYRALVQSSSSDRRGSRGEAV